jgi:hypothetical protein
MKLNVAKGAKWPLVARALLLLAATEVHAENLSLHGGRRQPSAEPELAIRQQKWTPPASSPRLDEVVMKRAEENLELATSANSESKNNMKEVLAMQQTTKAREALDVTFDAYDLARKSVPLTKTAEVKTRVFRRDSEKFAKDAVVVAKKAETITIDAAKEGAKEVMLMIENEAHKAAEDAHESSKDWKKKRAEVVAKNVAAAMQPFHLGMLRAQKGAAQMHAKAVAATDSAQKLADKAEAMAAQAQGMQTAGMTMQAQQLMMMAHGAMNAASNLRGSAMNLYNLANKVNRGIGSYQVRESEAAANAAATTVFNPPMKFPETFP